MNGIKVSNTHTQVITCYLKRATGSCRSLFKQEHDVLAGKVFVGSSGAFHALEILSELE